MQSADKEKSNIHAGHRKRVFERFLASGLDSMPDHNIIELLLFFAISRGDTNQVAHNLIDRFGSLSGVFDASYEELLRVDGVGRHSATLIKLIPSMCRSYFDDKIAPGLVLSSVEQIGEFIKPKFIGRNRETVFLICLDEKSKLLKCEMISEGIHDYVPIAIRRIVESAVGVGAAAIVLVHNHPQGFALPSGDDVNSTNIIRQALAPLSIRLIDHIIVAQDDFVSLSQSGLLTR